MSIKTIFLGATLLVTITSGCAATGQLHAELQYRQLVDDDTFFGSSGIGVLTPSAPTGQESDRQALADSLGDILERDVSEANVVALPALLSAVNQAGLARAYSNMFDEYERTGILERDVLRQIGEAAGVRYVAKLNLGNFEQSTAGRAKIFGIRFLDTRTATIRVHLEIWDTSSGGIVWQGNEELTFAEEGVREKPVTFQQVAALASEGLVAKVGESGTDTLREEGPSLAHNAKTAVAPVDVGVVPVNSAIAPGDCKLGFVVGAALASTVAMPPPPSTEC